MMREKERYVNIIPVTAAERYLKVKTGIKQLLYLTSFLNKRTNDTADIVINNCSCIFKTIVCTLTRKALSVLYICRLTV